MSKRARFYTIFTLKNRTCTLCVGVKNTVSRYSSRSLVQDMNLLIQLRRCSELASVGRKLVDIFERAHSEWVIKIKNKPL